MEGGKITFVRNEESASEFCKTSKASFAVPPVWNCEIPYGGSNPGHKAITQNFVDAILDGSELIAPAEEGINSVEIANCILYSAWTDSTVELPLDAGAYEAALKEKIAKSRFTKKTKGAADDDINASFK